MGCQPTVKVAHHTHNEDPTTTPRLAPASIAHICCATDGSHAHSSDYRRLSVIGRTIVAAQWSSPGAVPALHCNAQKAVYASQPLVAAPRARMTSWQSRRKRLAILRATVCAFLDPQIACTRAFKADFCTGGRFARRSNKSMARKRRRNHDQNFSL